MYTARDFLGGLSFYESTQELKRILRTIDQRLRSITTELAILKLAVLTDLKSLKQSKNLLTLLEEKKLQYIETMEKFERTRITMNSMSPLECPLFERFETDYQDAFLEAIDISENIFTYENTLLTTVQVNVLVGEEYVSVRAVINPVAFCHMITNACREKLKLPLLPANPSSDLPEDTSSGVLGTTKIRFTPNFSTSPEFEVEAYVTQNAYANTPLVSAHPSVKEYLRDYQLADPTFDIPGEIELILNSIPPMDEPCNEQVHNVPNTNCCVLNSVLGWTVSGRAPVAEIKLTLWAQGMLDRIAKRIEQAEEFFRNARPELLEYL